MCNKIKNHMMYGSWDTNKIYLSFWDIFLAFYPPSFLNDPEYENFDKNGKKAWRYYPFIYIHVHKWWRSYDILFLKYNVRQTEMFDILAHFLPFQPLDNLENQNFFIEKNTWRYYHFTDLHRKWQSFDLWFLRWGARQT